MEPMKFDTNIDLDKSMSIDDFKESATTLLQRILAGRFASEPAKQKIIPHSDRMSFACPYCGDSQKNPYAKRGNIILKGKFTNFFKCHNCGEFKRVDNFFKDYDLTLGLDAINYIATSTEDFSNHVGTLYDMSMFIDVEAIDSYAIDRQEFLKFFGLMEVKESPVWSWLNKRLQFDATKFMYNQNENYIVILNLTQSGKILGAQKRTFTGANKYLTYTLTKIYELLHRDPSVIPDEVNAISQLYNICNINYARPVTLFEGAFDAFLFKNSVANAGANKSFPLELPIRYFFDKDTTGMKKAIEKMENGEEVFLWQKYLDEIGAPYRKKWDLNDLGIWGKENNIKLPNPELYFSSDSLDTLDL
jgi:predicted RNA-binding Zn-ribbon protein involved in translation (DUF1610 family)